MLSEFRGRKCFPNCKCSGLRDGVWAGRYKGGFGRGVKSVGVFRGHLGGRLGGVRMPTCSARGCGRAVTGTGGVALRPRGLEVDDARFFYSRLEFVGARA